MQQFFDPLSKAIDWLEACKSADLDSVMSFYDDGATIECPCCGSEVVAGKESLTTYWRSRLAGPRPSAYRLQDIRPDGDDVAIEFRAGDDKIVRLFFHFNDAGKIVSTRCDPCCTS